MPMFSPGVVLNGARIGSGSPVGANTLIPEGKEVPDGVLVVGSPVRIVRPLSAEEKDFMLETARGYVERSRRFASELHEQSQPAAR